MNERLTASADSPQQQEPELLLRYSQFKPDMSDDELAEAFDGWYNGRMPWEYPPIPFPHKSREDMFAAFIAGLVPDPLRFEKYLLGKRRDRSVSGEKQNETVTASTRKPAQTRREVFLRYSSFKPGVSDDELSDAFSQWYLKRATVHLPILETLEAREEMFTAFRVGAEPDAVLYEQYSLPEAPDSYRFETVAFPPIVGGRVTIQYRPYDDGYNENTVRIGQRVSIWRTEEYPHDGDDFRGVVTGVRKVKIADLPKQHQDGILQSYAEKGLDMSDGTLLLFWAEKEPTEASWSSDGWFEERNDITED